MEELKLNNKRIAKNTLLLYVRMLFIMITNLYVSRLVLIALGVKDFGLYNVVGGLVSMLSFLNSTLNSSTARFLSFELEENNLLKQNKIFNMALTIHIGIAVCIIIISESVGFWFFKTGLSIPENRKLAASIIYHLSVISVTIQIIQIPYNAIIISHEKMNVYAYISIVEAIFKLIISYIVITINVDKLILYSALVLMMTLCVAATYKLYCNKNYKESIYSFSYDKDMGRSMIAFSGWDLYGNISWMLSMQGTNILLNIFFGPVINASTAIASQVKNSVYGFSSNFLTAVKPQVVKSYSSGNLVYLESLIENASKYSFLLLYIISLPLILEGDYVLNIWLKKVPIHAVLFCRLNLIYNLINTLFYPLIIVIHATGKLKRISFITGSVYLLSLPLAYLLLKLNFDSVYVFIISILILLVASINNLLIVKRYMPLFSISRFLIKSVYKCILISFGSLVVTFIISNQLEYGWWRLLLTVITSTGSIAAFSFYVLFNDNERINVIAYLKSFIYKIELKQYLQ